MKILIVNTYDIQGGAARAAYRLHRALLKIGINSLMLVQIKKAMTPRLYLFMTKTIKSKKLWL